MCWREVVIPEHSKFWRASINNYICFKHRQGTCFYLHNSLLLPTPSISVLTESVLSYSSVFTAKKIKFFIKDFFSKYEQICRNLRIWSYLLKKSFHRKLNFFVQCLEWMEYLYNRTFMYFFVYHFKSFRERKTATSIYKSNKEIKDGHLPKFRRDHLSVFYYYYFSGFIS